MNRSEKLLQMFEIMSSGEKHALEIIHKSLTNNPELEFAVNRPGIGASYFKTEQEAKAYAEETVKKSGISHPAPQILKLGDPIFRQAGIKEVE